MALYKDYPLQDLDSIRVLTLLPGKPDVTIEISVGLVQLSTKPEFAALSYTWSNPTDERHPSYQEYDLVSYYISYGGKPIAVQQNLHEALSELRKKQEYTPLWIDAICIDQENEKELNHQLSLMPYIYCEATCVIVWLGREDPTTVEAIEFLHEGVLGIPSMMDGDATTGFLDSISRPKRNAFALLLRRKWFNRVWTLQEILLPRRTRCLCGSHELDIGAITMFAALSLGMASSSQCDFEGLNELRVSQLGGAAGISAWMGLTWPADGFGSRALLRYPKIDYNMELPRTFKWLVALELFAHEARQRNCSKLGDKILAPLAFALHEKFAPETTDFLPIKRKACSLIDCRLSVPELYFKFTRFLIDYMANLDILSRAHRDILHKNEAKDLNLPSWVPPFHEGGTTSLIDDLLFTQYDAAIHLGPYCYIKGSQANALSVRAVFFGRIIQISTHAAPADTLSAWFSSVRNSDQYKQEVALSKCHDLAHVVTQHLGDRLADCAKWEAERQKCREELLRSNLSTFSFMKINSPVSLRTIRKLFRFDVSGQRLIGLAPRHAQESDHICIIQGARVPFIVRESSGIGKYTLVGEAFAENFMHGEVQFLNLADRTIELV